MRLVDGGVGQFLIAGPYGRSLTIPTEAVSPPGAHQQLRRLHVAPI